MLGLVEPSVLMTNPHWLRIHDSFQAGLLLVSCCCFPTCCLMLVLHVLLGLLLVLPVLRLLPGLLLGLLFELNETCVLGKC